MIMAHRVGFKLNVHNWWLFDTFFNERSSPVSWLHYIQWNRFSICFNVLNLLLLFYSSRIQLHVVTSGQYQLESCLVLLGHRDFEDLWDAKRREYFIDRHSATFEVLANWFMEGGDLIRPDHIPIDIFLNEIPYYRLVGFGHFLFKHANSDCRSRQSAKCWTTKGCYIGIFKCSSEFFV